MKFQPGKRKPQYVLSLEMKLQKVILVHSSRKTGSEGSNFSLLTANIGFLYTRPLSSTHPFKIFKSNLLLFESETEEKFVGILMPT